MNVTECLTLVSETLDRHVGFESPSEQAELLIAAALGVKMREVASKGLRILSKWEQDFVLQYLSKEKLCPVPLYLGYCEVAGIRLAVSTKTLLPGTETEKLVEYAIDLIHTIGAVRAIDIGTGCGVLAVVLGSRVPSLTVYATDISQDALVIAARNVEQYSLSDRVSLHNGEWFDPLDSCSILGMVDIVVSNPPYCAHTNIPALPRQFLEYAPLVAIDGGPDGLRGHIALIAGATRYLRPEGLLIMQTESGQVPEVEAILRVQPGFTNTRSLPGSDGVPRFVVSRKA